jgi:Glutathione-dependent formaldehyde-activating enzyme
VVVARLLATLDLLLDRYSHYLSILNLQLAHRLSPREKNEAMISLCCIIYVVVFKTKGVVRTFCSDCGTSIGYLDEGISNELYIALGFFDHPESFRPEAHAYWREKLSWIEFADKLPRIEGYSRERDPALGTPNQRT